MLSLPPTAPQGHRPLLWVHSWACLQAQRPALLLQQEALQVAIGQPQVCPARRRTAAAVTADTVGGAGSDRTHLQLLWAVLRIDRPLGLDLRDLVRCQLVSREFAQLTLAHITHLDQPATAALHGNWWQPARLVSVQTAALQHAAMPAAAGLSKLRSLRLAVDAQYRVVDLQPLSALQRLQELQVTGGRTANAAAHARV